MGQAIVEFALILPTLMLLIGGMVFVGFLFIAALKDQQAVNTLADYVATGPGWQSHVGRINDESGCHADPVQPDLSGDVLTWRCHFRTGWLFDGLPITVSAIVGPTAVPEPSPS